MGRGTVSLIELLKGIDKEKYQFIAVFYYNYKKGNESDIKSELEKLKIPFILLPQKTQSIKIKILKECVRNIFFFNKKIKKLAIFWIDYFYKTKANTEKIVQLIKEFDIDLLYMNNQPITNLEGILASKITGIPAILHCRIEPKLNYFLVKYVNQWVKK